MDGPILDENEEFLLRHLNEYCLIPSLESCLRFPPRNRWATQDDTNKAVQIAIERLTYPEFEAAIITLLHYELVAGERASSRFVHITPQGRQFVRNLDNPDILKAFWWRISRNKRLAYVVLFSTALGVLGGLMSLAVDTLTFAKWLFGGG